MSGRGRPRRATQGKRPARLQEELPGSGSHDTQQHQTAATPQAPSSDSSSQGASFDGAQTATRQEPQEDTFMETSLRPSVELPTTNDTTITISSRNNQRDSMTSDKTTMATAQVIGQARDTDCIVCHEHFKEPKILPCGHVVCRRCLVSWLRIRPHAGCPLCRCDILEWGLDLESLEEEVEALPTDLALAEQTEARAVLDKDRICCVCPGVAATALCLHCQDMLCASCAKAHGKLSVSKHHKVEDLSSVTPGLLLANCPPTCSSHLDQAKALFCPTHGTSVCFQCAVVEHKGCPDLKGLGEKSGEARAMLSEMAASLTASESEMKEAIQRLDHHIQVTEETVQAAVTQIQKTFDGLVKTCVETCRGQMMDLVRDAAVEIQDRARAAIRILQRRKSQMTLHTAVVRRAEASIVPVTVSDMHSLMQTRVQALDCCVTLPAMAEVCSTMTFDIDEEALTQVEEALAELGQVTHVPADHLAVFAQPGKLIFDAKHGANIVLSNSNMTATHNVFGGEIQSHGIVLSHDPIATDVLYEVRLDKWGSGGAMAVGVVTDCPDNVTLPHGSHELFPALSISWEGVKLLGFGANIRVPHRVCRAMKRLRQGDHVGVSLDTFRRLHLHLNGEDMGVWARRVTGPCHALIDLWGETQRQVTALLPTTVFR